MQSGMRLFCSRPAQACCDADCRGIGDPLDMYLSCPHIIIPSNPPAVRLHAYRKLANAAQHADPYGHVTRAAQAVFLTITVPRTSWSCQLRNGRNATWQAACIRSKHGNPGVMHEPHTWISTFMSCLSSVDVYNFNAYHDLLQDTLTLHPPLLFQDPQQAAQTLWELESCMHYPGLYWEPGALGQLLVQHSPVSLRLHLEGLIGSWEGLGTLSATRATFGLLWLVANKELMQWTPAAFASHLEQLQQLLPSVNVPLVLTRDPTVACALLRVQPISRLAASIHQLPGYVLVCEVPGELSCEVVEQQGELLMEIRVAQLVGGGHAGECKEVRLEAAEGRVQGFSAGPQQNGGAVMEVEGRCSITRGGGEGTGTWKGLDRQAAAGPAVGLQRAAVDRRVLARLPWYGGVEGQGVGLLGKMFPVGSRGSVPAGGDEALAVRVAAILDKSGC